MSDPNRRGFLALAGAGAAAATVVAVAPAITDAAGASTGAAAKTAVPSHIKEPLVAYVRDAHTGEVAVMVGEREVVVHDRELAARIARAAG